MGLFEETNLISGQSFKALLEAIAERTFAQLQEAEAITPLWPGFPPTASGIPLSLDFLKYEH